MASSERIKNLTQFVADWIATRDRAAARRDHYLELKSTGVAITNAAEEDILQKMIDEADSEVRNVDAICIRMEALLARAQAGEDV